MEFLTALSLTFFMALISNAQLSERVDKAVYFKSIQFGQTISKNTFKDCHGANELSSFSNVVLVYDNLGAGCQKKYADLFNFHGTRFPSAGIYTTDKKQVYLIRLWRDLPPTDSIVASKIKYPPAVAALYDSLVILLGKPNYVKDETMPGYENQYSVKQTIYWSGYHISCQLEIEFGPNETRNHYMTLEITTGEPVPEQEKLLK